MVIRRKGGKIVDPGEGIRAKSKQHFQEQKLKNTGLLPTHRGGYDMAFWLTVCVCQLVGIACVSLVAYWCTLYGGFAWNSNANLQFFFHPLLMILGLIFCYGNAILIYRIFHFFPKWILKCIHAAMHLTALVLSSVGLVAVFENHRRTLKPDLYSLHSWVGITTFGFFCVQYVASFITFLCPGLPPTVKATMMPFHTFFGLGIFILAAGTALMGITEKLIFDLIYPNMNEKAIIGNCLGLCIVTFAFLVVFTVTRSEYKRRPLPSDSVSPTN